MDRKQDISSRATGQGIIHNKDRMARRVDTIIMDGQVMLALWRRAWRVWRVVVV